MTRISFRSLATRAVLAVGMIGVLAAPLPALAHDWNWHRPHPVYVAPVAYRSCNNALVGGLIGAAAGGLIGAGAGGHGRDGGAAAIMGLIGGAAVSTAVGAASCD
jgi:hypothetical protein